MDCSACSHRVAGAYLANLWVRREKCLRGRVGKFPVCTTRLDRLLEQPYEPRSEHGALLHCHPLLDSDQQFSLVRSIILRACSGGDSSRCFFLGRRLFSAEAALFGSALLALNSFHILYSQAARGYTLAVLLVTLCSLYFIRALEEADWHPTGAYVVSATAALYAHFFAVFVLLAQFFSLFFLKSRSRIVKRQIGLLLLVAGLGTPLAAFAAVHKTDPIFWLDHPSIRDVHHLFTYFFGSGLKFGLSALSIILAAREWWRRASSSTQPAYESAWVYVFVGLWLAVPVALTLLISHWRPVFSPRFLMICLPAVVLLVGEGLSSVKPPIARYGFAAVLFTSAITALPSYYRRPGLEDWRGVADYLTKNVQPSDVIVVDVYYRDAFDIAFRQSQQNCPTQKVMPLLPGRNVLKDVHRIWIVSCHPTRKAHDDVPATPRDFFLHSKANFVGIEVLRYDEKTLPAK